MQKAFRRGVLWGKCDAYSTKVTAGNFKTLGILLGVPGTSDNGSQNSAQVNSFTTPSSPAPPLPCCVTSRAAYTSGPLSRDSSPVPALWGCLFPCLWRFWERGSTDHSLSAFFFLPFFLLLLFTWDWGSRALTKVVAVFQHFVWKPENHSHLNFFFF